MMRIFIHFLCFFVSKTSLMNEAFILQRARNPCTSSLFFETNVNPSSMEYIDKQTRIDNPFILINPSPVEEISEETEFSSSNTITQNHIHELKPILDHDLVQTRETDESERNILEEVIQLRVNVPEKVEKLVANRKRTFQPLIQFDEYSKSLLCPSTIQEKVEINPENSQLGTDLNRALELDIKTNPSQFGEFQRYIENDSSELETLDNSIRIDFTKLKSRPQIIFRSHSSEQNTIKPEINYIYLLLPKNENVVMQANKNQVGVGDNLSDTHTDWMENGVNPVEVNSEKSFIHDVETKLEILHTSSVINESTNNNSEMLHSDDTNQKENGYELKVDESEMDYDFKEIDLSFLKNIYIKYLVDEILAFSMVERIRYNAKKNTNNGKKKQIIFHKTPSNFM